MPIPRRLVLATRNPGKVREILRICADWGVEWVTHEDAPWPDVPETGTTYLENAAAKAMAVAAALGLPAIADDSGIEVDALGGGPGVHSARFAGEDASDERNLRMLVERIATVDPGRRTGRYRCLAACAWPEGMGVWAEATCEGTLILEPRGSGGFGYDPIFIPTGEMRTMAELAAEEKDAISHRGRAFRGLRDALRR
ncbi:MAG TPA: RdgB/HAM1 family non-canonical purine NTP pyrophosphatase [Actinomycetota bacterium]